MSIPTVVIQSYPDILEGTPVFVGTRVPAKTFLEYLAAGKGLETFLEDFPSVRREQAVAALVLANRVLHDPVQDLPPDHGIEKTEN